MMNQQDTRRRLIVTTPPRPRPKHFGARTSADARDHVAPPSQVSQGAQELRRGDAPESEVHHHSRGAEVLLGW